MGDIYIANSRIFFGTVPYRHLYLVHDPDNNTSNQNEEIIRGGPSSDASLNKSMALNVSFGIIDGGVFSSSGGDIKYEIGTKITESEDNYGYLPGDTLADRSYSALNLGGVSSDHVWNFMKGYITFLQSHSISYTLNYSVRIGSVVPNVFGGTNSNAVAFSTLSEAGLSRSFSNSTFPGVNDSLPHQSDGYDFGVGGNAHRYIIGTGGHDALSASNSYKDYIIDGGNGDDTLQGNDGSDHIIGGAGADLISGGAGNDILDGLDYADTIFGNDGSDTITKANIAYGGDGSDVIIDARIAYGGDGNDTISAGNGSYQLFGDQGDDLIIGSSERDKLNGGRGSDVLSGGESHDILSGGAGADTFHGGSGADTIYGNIDADLVYGNIGWDDIFAGQGSDVVYGGQGRDVIYGNFGSDLLYGNLYQDVIFGGQGDDTIIGGQGFDLLRGNLGNDVIFGNLDPDIIVGGMGNDFLDGGDGNDTLFGYGGDDTLISGNGNDNLTGGVFWSQTDDLVYQNGADLFVFHSDFGQDTIMDFDPLEGDMLSFDRNINGTGLTHTSNLSFFAQEGESGDTELHFGEDRVQLVGVPLADVAYIDFTIIG